MKRWIWRHNEALFGLGAFMVGVILFFKVDQLPGDIGDNRFNMYLLEHGYRWLLGKDGSFWSAPFFYPAQNVTAYSDSHLGTFLVYAVYRILGASRETSFQLWALTLFALNYSATWIVLRKHKFHPVAVIAAAYLFTFPQVMAAQMGHAQLMPRFMVPLAFMMGSLFVESGRPKHLFWLLTACAGQLYLGIYLGYLLSLAISVFCLVFFLLRRKWDDVWKYIKDNARQSVYRRGGAYVVCCIAFFLTLLPLALPYYNAHKDIEPNPWWLVSSMLPHWQSYLNAPNSFVWGSFLRFGAHLLPYPVEHSLFLGAMPFAAMFAFLYTCRKQMLSASQAKIGLAMVGTVLLLAIFTFNFSGHTLYRYIYDFLPGAQGIRAVTRIILILIYPIAFIFCIAINCLFRRLSRQINHNNTTRPIFVAITVLALTALDQGASVDTVSKKECRRRAAKMQQTILMGKKTDSSFSTIWVVVNNDAGASVKNLDVMLAAQALGVNTVNGYSGYAPPGFPGGMLFGVGGDWCAGLGIWARMHPGMITNESLLQIGGSCDIRDGCFPIPEGGFRLLEEGKSVGFWALNRSAVFEIPNCRDRLLDVIVSFDLISLNSRTVYIASSTDNKRTIRLEAGRPQHVELQILHCDPVRLIRFETDANGVELSGADVKLFFRVENVAATEKRD